MDKAAVTSGTLDPAPLSWTLPGGTDHFAVAGLITLFLLLFLLIYLYAFYERYAERRGSRTYLRTTIPTMLTVGLAYDLVPPLADINILLPLSVIAAALARDIAVALKPAVSGND